MKKKVFICAGLVAFTLVGGSIAHYYSMQDQFIFRSLPLNQEHVYELEYPAEEVFLTTQENTQINALWFHQENPKGVILFFHGRAKNLNHWKIRAYPFFERGYDVFMIDYRGFGKSSKGFKESWLLEDGDLAYSFLRSHYPEEKIIICGHSLGTSIATWVAANHSPHALILEAPFYNMIEAASCSKPFIPQFIIRWILKYHLRTDQWIAKVNIPVYIFHGSLDKLIPYDQSKRLFSKIEHDKEKELTILPKADHGNIYQDPLYIKKLDEVLD